MTVIEKLIDIIEKTVEPLSEDNNYNNLLDKIGDARFVLIGEATHGTHEFYQARIEITKALIEKKNFMAVAIEGDWPACYRVHRYIQGKDDRKNSIEALSEFERFPQWMWRNQTMPPFLTWLRDFNDQRDFDSKIGFYGLDLYSLQRSMQVVINYLTKIDPEAAEQAKLRYSCFDHSTTDPQTYGYLTSIGVKKSCLKESIAQFLEMQHHAFDYVKHGGLDALDDYFYAVQNARLVKNAEHYYRAMYEEYISSWNIRDQHMTETLNVIADHLENRLKQPAKIIVWAHNSHVGDARATETSERGEINIGQLVREQHYKDTYLIGFSTYTGKVTAASGWDEPAQRKNIHTGLMGSYEALFHQVKYKNFLLPLTSNNLLEHYLQHPRLQRAIGVIYRPETERQSHYFFTKLPYQFDSIIHYDITRAVIPLDVNSEWEKTSATQSRHHTEGT